MLIKLDLNENSYNILVERGALNHAGEYLNLKRRVLIVTDSGVPIEYAKIIASQCSEPLITTIPQGESSKSFESYKMLLTKLIDNDFTRSDCVVAVGGGVVGDLSGFVASSYMRGIDFYNIPTTLLSQIDSSIGGKVAIDFNGVKNIVGAFYQPKMVIIDSDTLKTLPQRQISNGLAEAIKMALTSDKELFNILENEDIGENIDKIIVKALSIKKAVVEKDEKEQGLRKILNFGHTLGHGIESEQDGKLYHGECVALGMLPMCSKDVKKRLVPVLEKAGLKTKVKFNKDNAFKAIKHDKKFSGKNITLIKVNEIGSFNMLTAEESDVLALLNSLEDEK